ncbi:exopolysaccharide Pel transporter PelG [Trichococcus collinsii]|uniref:Uncharacterized membrane protein n=1 Tax=Trichococcus collinsii TaxID=157076 RepID=A0AB38A0Y2_9LACT|nr:exopolysaccharide Pel transporter PelG [Trichococcus collinsii]CZQ91652.1 Hypothetical protein Tcol_1125 [Trichococcus collinsii]SEA55608.1 Uncharacterized membrane protein [Trichococcus collinsii]
MAGIGFELKKIYKKNTVAAHIRGGFYSIFVTIGHVLITLGVLMIVKTVLQDSFNSVHLEQLYSAIVVYSFIFPLIFTSGITIVLSRYIADKLWNRKNEDIASSILGVMTLYIAVFSLPGILLLGSAQDLPLILKIVSYLLYMQMGLIYLLMTYVSALKNYKEIAQSFIIGMGTVIGLVLITRNFLYQNEDIVVYLIFYFALGTLLTLIGLYTAVRKVFRQMNGNYFEFLLYFKKYPKLFFSNVAYTVTMYAHNFLFWSYSATKQQVSVFYFSEAFDLATAFAVYSILPAAVLFVVRTEVFFYDTYRAYLDAINYGTGSEIKKRKQEMERSMWEEFLYSMEVQGLISMICLIIGMLLFKQVGAPSLTLEVFPYLVFGIYLLYFSFLGGTLMQYFENYDDSMRSFLLGLFLNLIFGQLTLMMGREFYGLGVVFSSFLTLSYTMIKLRETLLEIDFVIFTNGALRPSLTRGRLEKFVEALNDGVEKE